MQGANNEGADQTARMVCAFVECKKTTTTKQQQIFLKRSPYMTHTMQNLKHCNSGKALRILTYGYSD